MEKTSLLNSSGRVTCAHTLQTTRCPPTRPPCTVDGGPQPHWTAPFLNDFSWNPPRGWDPGKPRFLPGPVLQGVTWVTWAVPSSVVVSILSAMAVPSQSSWRPRLAVFKEEETAHREVKELARSHTASEGPAGRAPACHWCEHRAEAAWRSTRHKWKDRWHRPPQGGDRGLGSACRGGAPCTPVSAAPWGAAAVFAGTPPRGETSGLTRRPRAVGNACTLPPARPHGPPNRPG